MEKNQNTDRVGFGGFLISLFLMVVGVQWFAQGQIVMPYKGIFIFGAHARAASALWVFVMAGLGVYPYVTPRFRDSRVGATLLIVGLCAGIVTAGLAAVRISPPAALLVGVAATLLLALPGFMVCGVTAEANRQKQMNRNAEQQGGGYSPPAARSSKPTP